MAAVLIGPPGAGKGTLSSRLREVFECQISTGDLFRRALREDTALGREAKKFLSKGSLAPDSLTCRITEAALRRAPKSQDILLDGFPRNLFQAKALEGMLRDLQRGKALALFLSIPERLLVERLEGRLYAQKSGRVYHRLFNPPQRKGVCDETGEPLITREDDKREVILSRLQVYKKETAPLWDFYSSKGRARKISAAQPPDKVPQSALKALKDLKKGLS